MADEPRRMSKKAHDMASREALRIFKHHCQDVWNDLLDQAYDALGHPRRGPGRPTDQSFAMILVLLVALIG